MYRNLPLILNGFQRCEFHLGSDCSVQGFTEIKSLKVEAVSRPLSDQTGALSTAAALYVSLSAAVQKAAVHDGYAISRLSQDFPPVT